MRTNNVEVFVGGKKIGAATSVTCEEPSIDQATVEILAAPIMVVVTEVGQVSGVTIDEDALFPKSEP